jgi:hypothetical protein
VKTGRKVGRSREFATTRKLRCNFKPMMKNLLLKLRLIFWPFVRLVVLVAAGYAGLAWLFIVVLDVSIRVSLESRFWWLLLISSVTIGLLLRPRIHLLRIGKNERLRQLFYLTALATTGLAAANAADALVESSRTLVTLGSIYELPRHSGHHAYVSREIYLARTGITSQALFLMASAVLRSRCTSPRLCCAPRLIHCTVGLLLGWAPLMIPQQVTIRPRVPTPNFRNLLPQALPNFNRNATPIWCVPILPRGC